MGRLMAAKRRLMRNCLSLYGLFNHGIHGRFLGLTMVFPG